METPTAAFCGLWCLALGSAEIKECLLSGKAWEGQMRDSPAQDRLFMVLLMLSVAAGLCPCSQEGCGPTPESILFCALPLGRTALAKETLGRGEKESEIHFASPKRSIISTSEPPAITVPSPSPAPHGVWWLGERGDMSTKRG